MYYEFSDFEFKKNGQKYYADGKVELSFDSSSGIETEDIVFDDFIIDRIIDEEGNFIYVSTELTIYFLHALQQEFYGAGGDGTLYHDAQEWYIERMQG